MTIIHIADNQYDNLLDYLTKEDFWNDTRHQNLEKNRDTYVFNTFQKRGEHLGERNKVIIPNVRGYSEYIIDDVIERLNNQYEVRTTASYQELKKRAVIYPETLSEYSPSQATGHALDGTGWVPGIIQGEGLYRTFNIEEHTNPYNFLKRIASEFNLELKFRIEIDGNKVIKRYVDLLDRNGKWQGFEVTHGYNMTGLERREKSADIVTALLGVGPADADGNQKTVLVTNEEAKEKWGWINPDTGNREHLMDVYFPNSARSDMPESELRTLTENELDKRINLKYEYKTDFATLSSKLGEPPEIGDTVWVKNEDFNPPLYLEARVHTLKGGIKNNSNVQATLGDYVAFTEAEARSTFRDLQQQINAKIDDAQLRDYTYDRLTIDDKDTTVFEEGKTFAELQAGDAQTAAENHADTVASNAESNAKDYADTVSGQALIDAQNYAVAQEVYDSKMTEIANDLSDKAGIEYVDGQLQLKQGEIPQQDNEPSNPNTGMLWLDTSQSPNVMKRFDGSGWVKASPTDASEVGSYTINEVDNKLLNKVSVTQYDADMDGVVSDIQSNSTLIGQNEDAIALKADSSRVDTLEGTVSDHSSELSVMSDEISSKVEADYVTGEIDKLENDVNTHLRFDGNGYVSLGSNIVLEEGQGWTVEIHLMLSDGENNRMPIGTGGESNNRFYYRPYSGGNGIRFHNDYGDIADLYFKEYMGGNLHRLTVSCTVTDEGENNLKMYVDGVLVDTDTIANTRFKINSFGHAHSSHSYDWAGTMHDVRVWNKALSDTEVKDMHDKELSGNEEGLIGYWLFDEGIGSTARDSAGNNDGSINGPTWKGAGTKAAELLDVNISQNSTDITQNANAITSKAEQSELDTLTGRVSSAESTITQHADEIELKVNEDGVISSINQSAESVDINANKINLDGHVTADHIKSLNGLNINNQFVVDSNGNVTVSGELQGATGTFNGSIETPMLTVGQDDFSNYGGYDEFGLRIQTVRDNQNGTYDATGYAFFNTLNNGLEVYRELSDGSKSDLNYIYMRGEIIELLSEYLILGNSTSAAVLDRHGNLEPSGTATSTSYWNIKDVDGETIFRAYWGSDAEEVQVNKIDLNITDGRIINQATRDTTTSASANMYVATNGYYARSTSAKKYKEYIETVDIDFHKILDLEPKSWIDKQELEQNNGSTDGLKRYYGAIADDFVDIGLEEYAVYEDSEIENFNDRAWTLLIPVVRDLKQYTEDEINWLKMENDLLKARVNKLEEAS